MLARMPDRQLTTINFAELWGPKHSAEFAAPEFLCRELLPSQDAERALIADRIDVWALGITALMLLDGESPWSTGDLKSDEARTQEVHTLLMQSGTHGKPPPFLDAFLARPECSQEFKEFVRKCLRIQPGERPSITELIRTDAFLHRGRNTSGRLSVDKANKQVRLQEAKMVVVVDGFERELAYGEFVPSPPGDQRSKTVGYYDPWLKHAVSVPRGRVCLWVRDGRNLSVLAHPSRLTRTRTPPLSLSLSHSLSLSLSILVL